MNSNPKYQGTDAVRNAIASHQTMLVSLPREVGLRAGIQRGVQIRVDQDPKSPGTIILEVINPADLSAELKAWLTSATVAATKKEAEITRKENHAKKLEESAQAKAKKAAKAVADKARLDAKVKALAKKVKETAEAAKAEADKKPEVLETPEAPDAELLAEIFPAEPASDAEYQTKW